MTEKTSYWVEINSERPDYRRVKAFLWNDERNVNSDGNASNPASKDWTELTLMTREEPFERVDFIQHQKNPLILKVTSADRYLAVRAAYLLAKETNGRVAESSDLTFKNFNSLKNDLGEDFDLVIAKNRFDKSIYGQTTSKNPYSS